MPELNDKRGKIFPNWEKRVLKYYTETLLIGVVAFLLAMTISSELQIRNLESQINTMKKNIEDIALNALKDSIRISKLQLGKDLNFTNGTVNYNLLVNDAAKYDSISNDCKMKQESFLRNPTQTYFECNGVVAIKTGNYTYRDFNGNSMTVDYGFHVFNSTFVPNNETMKIISWKKCWQEYPMEKEVCTSG